MVHQIKIEEKVFLITLTKLFWNLIEIFFFYLDEKLVSIGGFNDGTAVQVFDPITNTWTSRKEISYLDRYDRSFSKYIFVDSNHFSPVICIF
jgi:hypothetical protein